MYEQISQWLTEPHSYSTGLQLLKATGCKGIVYGTLALGEDAHNRNRLEEELQKWIRGQTSINPIGPAAGTNSNKSLAPVQVGFDYGVPGAAPVVTQLHVTRQLKCAELSDKPTDYQALKEQTFDLMNERSELKARLRAYSGEPAKQAQRRDWAFRILFIGESLDELYSRLDFFDQYGYMPPLDQPPSDKDDTAQLMNMRSYVSRYEAKLRKKTLTPKQRQSAEKLLKQYSDEKQRLELKLSKNKHDSYSAGQQTQDCPIDHPTFSGA